MSEPRQIGRLARTLRGLLGMDDVLRRLDRQQQDVERLGKAVRAVTERLEAFESRSSKEGDGVRSQVKDARLQLRDVNASLQEIRTQLGSRGMTRLMKSVRMDTRALLRRAVIDPRTLPYPYRLTAQRASLASQREEDGITWAIFEAAGIESQRFIDIGSGIDGGISGFFARECGWQGMMVDAKERHVRVLHDRFSRQQVTPVNAFVTRENVNDLITAAGFDGAVDLMSIDIDGMDYWIWDALTATKPRLVIVEYNALFGSDRAVTVPYTPAFDRSQFSGGLRNYYGASLPAFVRLAARKGYRLVAIEPNALNAFFLRDDVAPGIPGCSLDALPYTAVENSREDDIYALAAEAGLALTDIDA